jgi:hypothetical protein
MNRRDDLLALLGALIGGVMGYVVFSGLARQGLMIDSLDRFSDDFMSFKRDQGTVERRDTMW